MSSMTNALKHLSEKGFINYDRYGFISRTREGEKYAENIFLRHKVLKQFLKKVIGLDEEQAEENACRMEHVMDMDVISKISKLVDFLEKENISQEFSRYLESTN
jgi:DtxR family Mn-dependent transcriptional regulator